MRWNSNYLWSKRLLLTKRLPMLSWRVSIQRLLMCRFLSWILFSTFQMTRSKRWKRSWEHWMTPRNDSLPPQLPHLIPPFHSPHCQMCPPESKRPNSAYRILSNISPKIRLMRWNKWWIRSARSRNGLPQQRIPHLIQRFLSHKWRKSPPK